MKDKYMEWYESLMEYAVDKDIYYKCKHCGGPVRRGVCCAWCESTDPE